MQQASRSCNSERGKAMKVENTNYIATHGKAPKGKGRWLFDIGAKGAWTVFDPMVAMSLGEAKKLALREARALGADAVQVAP
jgi:hypothetical protein